MGRKENRDRENQRKGEAELTGAKKEKRKETDRIKERGSRINRGKESKKKKDR